MSTHPVLCAVDISDGNQDEAVVRQAAKLAELEGAALDFITVLPDFGMSVVGSFFDADHHEKAVEEAKSRLTALVAGVLGDSPQMEVRHVVATGSAYEEILKAAQADEASLIVIGAHKPDFKDYLLGPNAARVVRHSDCSVYVVR